MISSENIQAAYANPDLLLGASRNGESPQNIACDVSSRARVIKLLDCRVRYDGNEIYVPGNSYLLSYREAEKTIKTRKEITIENVDVFSKFVEHVLRNGKPDRFFRSLDNESRRALKSWYEKDGLFEINSFSQIRKNRMNDGEKIDLDGLVLLQNLNPITPLRAYEFNGVSHSYDRVGKISLPAEIGAKEAEFTFLSQNHAKITDGNESVGKYKDGILTLKEPSIVVHGIEDKIKIKSKTRLRIRAINDIDVAPAFITLSLVGAGYGAIVGSASYGLLKLIFQLESMGYYVGGSAITCGITGGILGLAISLSGTRRFKGEYLSGNALMDIGFHGIVKDKRFENIEDLLG